MPKRTSRSSRLPYPCTVCGKNVFKDDEAYSCGATGVDIHWTHSECIQTDTAKAEIVDKNPVMQRNITPTNATTSAVQSSSSDSAMTKMMEFLSAQMDDMRNDRLRMEQELKEERQKDRQERERFLEQVMNRIESSGSSTSRINAPQGLLKLPNIQIPVFKGDILDWPSFWDIFYEMVHKHARFSNIEKMNFLLTHLDEKVKKAVQNISFESRNYPDVVQILKDRYENTREIQSAHVQALLAIGPVKGLAVPALQDFFDAVEGHARGLLIMENDDTDILDLKLDFVVQSLFEKLPLILRERLIETAGVDVKTRLSLFRRTLRERIKIIESVQTTTTSFSSTGIMKVPHTDEKPKFSMKAPHTDEKPKFETRKFAAASLIAAEDQAKPEKRENTGKSKVYCSFCKEVDVHRSFECPKYSTLEERLNKLGSACRLCLRDGHWRTKCHLKGKIICKNCKLKNHNSALCMKLFEKSASKNESNNVGSGNVAIDAVSESESFHEDDTSTELTSLCQGDEDTAMPTFVVSMRNPQTEKEVLVHGMLDTASKRTFLSNRIAKELSLSPKRKISRKICTFGSKNPMKVFTDICDFELLGCDKKFIGLTGNIVHSEITGTISLSEIPLSLKDKNTLKNLTVADPYFCKSRPFQIDILIGNDFVPMLLLDGKVKLEKSGTYLLNSRLGWVSSGFIQGPYYPSGPEAQNLALCINEVQTPVVFEEEPSFPVESLWSLDSIGLKESDLIDVSWGDDVALQKFRDTVQIDEDGRISVQWLKKDSISELPTNFSLALCRLRSLLRKLSKNPEYMEKYQKNFTDQLEKGVIEEVTPEMNKGFKTSYIPHHAVITPLKKTTKIRIVYDASAKQQKDNKSLNECLFRGPNLLADICGVLMRFRCQPIALLADIEKAFLQVTLQESERDLTRFLWLRNSSKWDLDGNLQILRFKRVPFGFKTSPFLLMGAIWFVLDRVTEKDKPVAEQIRQNLYMDNLVVSVSDISEAKNFYETAKRIFNDVKMNLREWNSNSEDFQASLHDSDRDSEKKVKVLGLLWDISSDSFSMTCADIQDFQQANTKGQILACVASIFDPLGFVSCLKIQGMIFLQTVWRAKMDWDSILPSEFLITWSEIVTILAQISSVFIPRLVNVWARNSVYELLCFCDASIQGYAALIYLRTENSKGVFVNLVFAKARLTPIQRMTIPRAELLAVLIGTRCLKFVRKHLSIHIRQIYLWTDSQIVLHWLQNETHDQGVFVSNRVFEIVNCSDVKFGYVVSSDNPADLATKMRNSEFEIDWNFWFHGPLWLLNSTESYPVVNLDFSENIESMENVLVAGGATEFKNSENADLESIFDVLSYKYFSKLVRISAWVLRFVTYMKHKVEKRKQGLTGFRMQLRSQKQTEKKLTILSADEILHAQTLWLKNMQYKAFPDLFTAKIKRSNFAQCLRIFQDSDGLLKCRGRLANSDLPQSAKFPILLPAKSSVTFLIVLSSHRVLFHAGVMHTLSHIRNTFWIPKGRSVVQKALKRCMICVRFRAVPYSPPPMPDLPKERSAQSSAFTYTGLDYFGPLYCKDNNGRQQKVWGVLFTCMVVRAVHLELVSDMTADNFLCALRRFAARRGKPNTIFADNAAQFKTIQKLIQRSEKIEFQENQPPAVLPQFHAQVNWRFIPEVSPWMGGFYERLVGVTKNALKKALGKTILSFEQLRTVFTEAEAVVNSRPLTYVNMTGADLDVDMITPQHFLTTGTIDFFPILSGDDPADPDYIKQQSTSSNILHRWKTAQYYLNQFWNLWRNQYLTNLRERHSSDKFPSKKSQVFRPPQEGEVVLVKNVNAPRNSWKLAKIITVHKSKDKEIRSVDILISGSRNIMTRPVSALFPLELKAIDNLA